MPLPGGAGVGGAAFRVPIGSHRFRKRPAAFPGRACYYRCAMRPVTPELLAEMARRLVDELGAERVILFGSYAWGAPTEDSDVDLLVVVPGSEVGPVARAVRAHRCLRGLGVSKDILVKTRAEVEREGRVPASLVREILTRGRILHG